MSVKVPQVLTKQTNRSHTLTDAREDWEIITDQTSAKSWGIKLPSQLVKLVQEHGGNVAAALDSKGIKSKHFLGLITRYYPVIKQYAEELDKELTRPMENLPPLQQAFHHILGERASQISAECFRYLEESGLTDDSSILKYLRSLDGDCFLALAGIGLPATKAVKEKIQSFHEAGHGGSWLQIWCEVIYELAQEQNGQPLPWQENVSRHGLDGGDTDQSVSDNPPEPVEPSDEQEELVAPDGTESPETQEEKEEGEKDMAGNAVRQDAGILTDTPAAIVGQAPIIRGEIIRAEGPVIDVVPDTAPEGQKEEEGMKTEQTEEIPTGPVRKSALERLLRSKTMKNLGITSSEEIKALAATHGGNIGKALIARNGGEYVSGIVIKQTVEYLRGEGVQVVDPPRGGAKRRGGDKTSQPKGQKTPGKDTRIVTASPKRTMVTDDVVVAPFASEPPPPEETNPSVPPVSPPCHELSSGVSLGTTSESQPAGGGRLVEVTTLDLVIAISRAKALGAAAKLVERIIDLYPEFAPELNEVDELFDDPGCSNFFRPSFHDSPDSSAAMRLVEFADRFREAMHLFVPAGKLPQ